jgi:hypothetical protein
MTNTPAVLAEGTTHIDAVAVRYFAIEGEHFALAHQSATDLVRKHLSTPAMSASTIPTSAHVLASDGHRVRVVFVEDFVDWFDTVEKERWTGDPNALEPSLVAAWLRRTFAKLGLTAFLAEACRQAHHHSLRH